MEKEQPTKIDIVKIQMVRDGTLDYGRKTIRSPQDLAELGLKFIKNADREMFLLVSLDTKNHINCIHVVSIGTVNAALVSPRDVLKAALLSNASKVAFIHNHPSGDVEASEDDIRITERVTQCGDLFDIQLLDHVIISDDGSYQSFLEKGLLKKSANLPLPQIREKESGGISLQRGTKPAKWTLKVYIPVESDEPEVFNTREEAEKEVESLSLMQPENLYTIEEIEDI